MDAKVHLDEAVRLLTGEVYRGTSHDNMKRIDGVCTLVWDLERIDCAIGPKGESVFARMADTIQNVFVEIKAAREAMP